MHSPKSSRSLDQLHGGDTRNANIQIFLDPDANDENQPGPTTRHLDRGRMPLADRTDEFKMSLIKHNMASLPRKIRREIAHARQAQRMLQYYTSNYKF
jgi:hypothetical protein